MRIVTLSIIACFTSLASAQQVGDFVIVVSPSVEMRDKADDGAVIATLERNAASKVIAIEGDQLRIRNKEIIGWVSRRQVIGRAEALAFYTAEIQRNPSAWAYERRATHFLELDPKSKAALEDLEAALQLDPQYAKAYKLRGEIRCVAGEIESGMADLNRAILLDPTLASAFKNRGVIRYFLFDERKQGLVDVEKAIELNPHDPDAYRDRGDIRYFLGDHDGALADYSESIRIHETWGEDAKLAHVHTGRGVILERKGRFAEAAADFAEAIRQQPDYLSGHRRMAWLRATCPDEKFRDGKQAIEHALEAKRLSKSDDPLIMETLAAAYAETDQFDEALEWMEKALQTSSTGLVAEPRSEQERQAMLATFREHRPWRQIPLSVSTP